MSASAGVLIFLVGVAIGWFSGFAIIRLENWANNYH